VGRRHALILQTNGRHVLRDEGAPGGTQVNGQPVTQQLLQDGDQITVGRVTMLFNEKATASPHRRHVDAPRSPAIPPPITDANTCPYCGTIRDPLTGACACTVSADTPFGPPDAGPVPASSPFGVDAWSAPSVGGAPRLVALDGPYAGQQFPLRSGETTIGREPGRDVALIGDPTTSRRHAVIVQQNGAFVLRDEGSANGTFVNGARVTEQTLQLGDEVRFGSNRFRFES
jgi:pSer/pThr/pTyr-binding forkhead associated (FHA) protein